MPRKKSDGNTSPNPKRNLGRDAQATGELPPGSMPKKMEIPARVASIRRDTKETQIALDLNLDGAGRFDGTTRLPFLDHMLALFARHGGFDLRVEMTGDLEVECHHAVEDLGIVLGQALVQAAGDKAGIRRFGQASVPMEETLVNVVLDFCGRPFLHWGVPGFDRPMIGEFATEMTEDFFRALANHGGLTLHIDMARGRNAHHVIEAIYKAVAHSLRQALGRDDRWSGAVPSTKGLLG